MTTAEYLVARTKPGWKFNTVVSKDAFKSVNRIHPIKQKIVSDIVCVAKEDSHVQRIIIFGSSVRHDCDVTSDLDICIDWDANCYDADGVLMPFTRNMRKAISMITKGHADVVNYRHLADTVLEKAVQEGVVVYEHDV